MIHETPEIPIRAVDAAAARGRTARKLARAGASEACSRAAGGGPG
jgi:hypothetical protein